MCIININWRTGRPNKKTCARAQNTAQGEGSLTTWLDEKV